MLDYGYRSKCCYAPISLAMKLNKKTNTKVRIWVCTKCKSRDVDILPKGDLKGQPVPSPFAEEVNLTKLREDW